MIFMYRQFFCQAANILLFYEYLFQQKEIIVISSCVIVL